MFLDFIEKLRDKPVAYRKRVVFFTASILTGIIVIVWLSTFGYRFGSKVVDPAVVEKQLQPFDEIKNSVGNFIDNVKDIGSEFFAGTSTTTATSTLEELKK
jgi:hypothetical protein